MTWLAALGLLALPLAGAAQAECRLALALGLDISSSVDPAEDRLQRQGLAAALTAPEIVEALLSVPGQDVALAVFEWSGRYQQDMTLDWRLLQSRADILAAARAIAGSKRRYAEFPTAIGFALGYAAGVFRAAPPCQYLTLDMSGDGRNNEGFSPVLAYRNFPLDEVTVNGLVIGGSEAPPPNETAGLTPERILRELLRSMPVARAARSTARLTGMPRNQLYELALTLRDATD